jgi:signal peptidase I
MNTFFTQAWSFIKTVAIAAFLAFFLIRGFVFEPFRIPSSSMMPNLLVGDYLVVSKFAYGNRLPLTNYFFWERAPARGDIAVFRRTGSGLPGSFFGLGPTLFIKRVVGVPGDTIAYRDQTLFINGQAISTAVKGPYTLALPETGQQANQQITATLLEEDLLGVQHSILHVPNELGPEVAESLVPQGYYVMMGDNRDNSRDSRYWQSPAWGFVPKADIMGRAEFIVWSWAPNWQPRFERIFQNLRASLTEVKTSVAGSSQ